MKPPRYVQSAPPPFVITPSMFAPRPWGWPFAPHVLLVDETGEPRRVDVEAAVLRGPLELPAGCRHATEAERRAVCDEWTRAQTKRNRFAAREHEHDGRAHVEPVPAAHYVVAGAMGQRAGFRLGRDELTLLHGVAIGRARGEIRTGRVRPLPGGWPALANVADAECADLNVWRVAAPSLDVGAEVDRLLAEVADHCAAGQHVRGAALVAWGIPWLHAMGLADGNGRTSRAAAYAITLAGDPELRELHHRRIGATGRESLLWIERVRRRTDHYFRIQNAAHRDAFDGVNYRRPDLSAHVAWIAELIADAKARRASVEDEALTCPGAGR